MVLEHLMIVAPGMAAVIEKLSSGVVPDVHVDISRTKPKGEHSPENLALLIAEFTVSMQAVKKKVTEGVKNRNSRVRLRHPWFGPLTAREWNWLLASHQRLHRRQIEEIRRQSIR